MNFQRLFSLLQTISGRAAQLITMQRTIETDLGYIDVRKSLLL